jgi:hypothetical protein
VVAVLSFGHRPHRPSTRGRLRSGRRAKTTQQRLQGQKEKENYNYNNKQQQENDDVDEDNNKMRQLTYIILIRDDLGHVEMERNDPYNIQHVRRKQKRVVRKIETHCE